MIVAAQMWIFSQMAGLDEQIAGLLRGLAGAGYTSIEGLRDKAPHDLKTLQTAGIAYGAIHLTTHKLEPLEPLLAFLNEVGVNHVCCSGPLEWNARTADDYRRTATFMNEKGSRLREHEIRLHYHNHEFEFDKVEGERTAMDMLLSELDPDAVTLCFDAGWAERAGQNAAEFMGEHSERIGVLHLRDFRGPQSVPLGLGDIDLAAQIALLSHLPNLHYVAVEQDPSFHPLADMQTSRRYLRDKFGL